jgi:hypothetical protein
MKGSPLAEGGITRFKNLASYRKRASTAMPTTHGDQNNNDGNLSPSEIPIGTWTLLCLISLGMTVAWLFLYFGVFLPRGSVQ